VLNSRAIKSIRLVIGKLVFGRKEGGRMKKGRGPHSFGTFTER
jgi:hypothetical protein